MNRRLKKRGSDKPLSSDVIRVFHGACHLVFYYAKFQFGHGHGKPRLSTEECVWRAPPTLDAKHLWFMNLEDCAFGYFHIAILTESVI